MTATSPHTAPEASARQGARIGWGYLVAEGVLLILVGIAAIVFPAVAGIAAAVLFGWILIISGIGGLISAFSTRPHLHFAWSLASSILAIVAGLVAALFPFAGVTALVIVIAAWLALDGVTSLMIGLDLRRSGRRSWGWPIVSAIVDWILTIAVLLLSPIGGLLLVGVIVGVDLIFGGLALLALGGALRRAQA
jgi:uncharacterized membrane protein HdeD (DUF308 family)